MYLVLHHLASVYISSLIALGAHPYYSAPIIEIHRSVCDNYTDARQGYWSVKLDDESSILTTFNSPFGAYSFKRLTFGLNLSQYVFQERMDNTLKMCPGTISIADDVGVFGRDADITERFLGHCDIYVSLHPKPLGTDSDVEGYPEDGRRI